MTPSCFLVKISQILQKVIVFFLEKEDEIKTSFWHIWIAQWLKFFRTTADFFSILAIFRRKRRVDVGSKVLLWVRPLSINNWTLKKFFKQYFCLLENVDNIGPSWGSKGPRTSQKGLFRGCWIDTQNFGNFNLIITDAILMKLTTIMYLHESVNRKALRVRNSFYFIIIFFFWLNCITGEAFE